MKWQEEYKGDFMSWYEWLTDNIYELSPEEQRQHVDEFMQRYPQEVKNMVIQLIWIATKDSFPELDDEKRVEIFFPEQTFDLIAPHLLFAT